MDHANYELARYMAEDMRASVHLVGYKVASLLAEHPNVKWHKVAQPLNSAFLAGGLLKRDGHRIANKLVPHDARVVVNGGNCDWGDVNWVHYIHAAFQPQHKQGSLRHWKKQLEHSKYLKDERRALQRARVVIANSQLTRQHLIKYLSIPDNLIHTVYYGNDPLVFRPASYQEHIAARAKLLWTDNRLVAVFVGALGDRRKGFDVLFDAWTSLCSDSSWDVDLVAIGTGAELEFWREKARQYKLGDRVRLLGFTKNVSCVMAAADALISPTRYEAYGLGVHEALCCGLPAFVTRSAGVAERYPKELSDLLLDDPPNACDLIRRLKHWRANVNDYKARVAKFSEQLRQRTWTDMAREIVELIDNCSRAN